jgi:hypothetical protein
MTLIKTETDNHQQLGQLVLVQQLSLNNRTMKFLFKDTHREQSRTVVQPKTTSATLTTNTVSATTDTVRAAYVCHYDSYDFDGNPNITWQVVSSTHTKKYDLEVDNCHVRDSIYEDYIYIYIYIYINNSSYCG